jgi:transposase-like protein
MAAVHLLSPGPAPNAPEQASATTPMHVQPWFHQELAALRKLERIIWPQGPRCPHCGATDRIGAVTGKGARPGLKFCCHCRKQFRATIGTIFEGSHVPLHKWLQTCLLLTAGDSGISAHQLHQHLNVTYKTALLMVRRLESLVATAIWEIGQITADEAGGAAPAFGRRRIRWRRRRPGTAAAREFEARRSPDEDSVPWVYPAPPADPAFRAFAAMAREFGCLDDEAAFDAILRRIAHPARMPVAV